MKEKLKQLLILFLSMLKIGTFTFGGGYAMISLIRREFVENKKWITDEDLITMITISESTPGPIAINMATFVGFHLFKFLGAFIATLGVVIPSFVIILVISIFLKNFMSYEIVEHAFVGINCAVSILIGTAFFSLKKALKKEAFSIIVLILSIISSFVIIFFNLNISTVFLILSGSILALIYYIVKLKLQNKKDKEEKE